MMRKSVPILCAGILVIGVCAIAPAVLASGPASGTDRLEEKMMSATALLYGQLEDGSLKMFCTITAFEREKNVYKFVTAAHCVAEDDTVHDRVAAAQTNWYITFDEPDRKDFYPAKLVGAGYQHEGDDFAVLEVTLDRDVPTVALAANDPALGEDVSNIASPLGLGKQLFRGHISMKKLDRPVIDGDINWRGATLVQMSAGPGSSGSAVVGRDQKGIVAFLVGTIGSRGSSNIVCIPVSKFKKFWTDLQAGKYKWYKKDSAKGSTPKGAKTRDILQRLEKGITFEVNPPASIAVPSK